MIFWGFLEPTTHDHAVPGSINDESLHHVAVALRAAARIRVHIEPPKKDSTQCSINSPGGFYNPNQHPHPAAHLNAPKPEIRATK
jgi:hypothetical protein